MHTFREILIKLIENKSLNQSEKNIMNQFDFIIQEENLELSIIRLIKLYIHYKITLEENRLIEFMNEYNIFKCRDINQVYKDLEQVKHRNARIFFKQEINKFKIINWDNDTILHDILDHLYKKSLFDLENIHKEKDIIQYKDIDTTNECKTKKMFISRIAPDKETLFTFKNKPTMTLDEYVNFIQKTNEATLNKLKTNQQNIVYRNNLYQLSDDNDDEFQQPDHDTLENKWHNGNLYKQG